MRALLACAALLALASCLAQAPQRMSFQAVLRDASDALIANGPVGLRISVLHGTANGAAVYVETHSALTNANGLVTLEIGGGAAESGSFAAIDWANGPYFLKTETDPNGGTSYSITGTSQLLSVPYALHAANNMQGPPGPQGPPGEPGCDMVRSGNMIVVYTGTHAYGFYQSQSSQNYNAGNWASTALNGEVLGAVASERTIVVYTTTNAYGFYQSQNSGSLNAGNWASTALNGTVLGATSNQNQVVVYTSSNAYGLHQSQSSGSLNAANWASTALSGSVIGAVAARHQIVVYTSTHAYGYYQTQSSGQNWNAGNWSSTSLSGAPIEALPSR
ncbi:MAG: hypothetical protein ACK4L7_03295 [Flavobacteriales bacterium]